MIPFENNLIRLQQIVELLRKKQSFLSEQNQNIQSLFEDKLFGWRNCWDRGVWWQDLPNHRLSSSFCSEEDKNLITGHPAVYWKHHDFEKPAEHQTPEARSAEFFWKLHALDLLRLFQGSSNWQGSVDSLRLQNLKSAVKREASKMLTSITVTDNFSVEMDI